MVFYFNNMFLKLILFDTGNDFTTGDQPKIVLSEYDFQEQHIYIGT